MSKAVEKAYEAYPLNESNRYNHEWNAKRVGFQQGYEQAEKDLALTWEDISSIETLLLSVYALRLKGVKMSDEGFYKEVLKLFNERRNKI